VFPWKIWERACATGSSLGVLSRTPGSYNHIIFYELALSLVIYPFSVILFSWVAPSIITQPFWCPREHPKGTSSRACALPYIPGEHLRVTFDRILRNSGGACALPTLPSHVTSKGLPWKGGVRACTNGSCAISAASGDVTSGSSSSNVSWLC
jgi:hypothetical protein